MTASGNRLHVQRSGHLLEAWFWWCHHCLTEHEFGSGYAIDPAAANDQARDHINRCPTILQGLDRLLSDLATIPRYRGMWLTKHLRVTACAECQIVIRDVAAHTEAHLQVGRR